jgi:NodT family efflux transporter outer membrane factor (OMF) lipoprotein
MRRPCLSVAVLLATAVSLGGCTLDPPTSLPATDVRPTWRDGSHDVHTLANTAWFDLYRDDVLRQLIRNAVAGNPDLAIALTRIDEARAIAKATGADLYPRIDLAAAGGRAYSSRLETPFGDRSNGVAGIFFDMSWELDLFGRVRSERRAAQAFYFESVDAHRDVGIRLVSEVARLYFELRELDELLEITRRTMESRREYVDLAKIRFEGGKTSEMDFRQAESEYYRTETVYVDVQRQITVKENEISVLLGRSPTGVPRGRRATEQPLPAAVPAGLPSHLLQRRPDILAAGEALAAETALVGAARANLYPRIALTGTLGTESDALSDLFTSEATTASLIAGLLQPIFNAGKNRALVEAQCARMRIAMEDYRRIVLAAFGEVEDALVGYRRFGEQRAVQAKRVESLRKVLELAEIRYEGGVSEYLEVLDAQRGLFDAEIEEAETIQNHLVSLTALYKALGGGWDPAFGACAVPTYGTSRTSSTTVLPYAAAPGAVPAPAPVWSRPAAATASAPASVPASAAGAPVGATATTPAVAPTGAPAAPPSSPPPAPPAGPPASPPTGPPAGSGK